MYSIVVGLRFPSSAGKLHWLASQLDEEVACDIGDPDAREIDRGPVSEVIAWIELEPMASISHADDGIWIVADVPRDVALGMAVAVGGASAFEGRGGMTMDGLQLTTSDPQLDEATSVARFVKDAFARCD